jgi:hypothetical protein
MPDDEYAALVREHEMACQALMDAIDRANEIKMRLREMERSMAVQG